VPTEQNPRAVFQRMFGKSDLTKAKADAGVLDLVLDDAKALSGKLGGADRRKLDEYLYSVHEVERQIQTATTIPTKNPPADTKIPEGIPPEVPDYIRVMLDLVVLSFQTDTTRIASVMLSMGGSDRAFPFLGINSSHHHYSHHEKKAENLDALHAIDKFYIEQYGYLIRKLAAIPEGNGTVLDNCMLLYGSPLRDGNLHDRGDLPMLLAGSGGGTVTTGRSIAFQSETPVANLYLNMLSAFGLPEKRFSDSTHALRI
jgi:hypothetical protein